MLDVRRREFITLLGGAAAWPLTARAQQAAMPIVGFVEGRSAEATVRQAAAFRKALSETGYVEGQNVMVEYNWLDGQYDRLPAVMADLVRRRVTGSWPTPKTIGIVEVAALAVSISGLVLALRTAICSPRTRAASRISRWPSAH